MDSNLDFDRVREKMLWSMAEHILVNYLSIRLSSSISKSGKVDWDRDVSPYLSPVQNADPKLVKDLSRCDFNVLITLYYRNYFTLLPSQIKKQHLYLLRTVRNQFAHQTSRIGEEDIHFTIWEPVVRMFLECLGVSAPDIHQYELLRDTEFRIKSSKIEDDTQESKKNQDEVDKEVDKIDENKIFLDSIPSVRGLIKYPPDFNLSTIVEVTNQVLSNRVSYIPEYASSSNVSLSEIVCYRHQCCCFVSKYQRGMSFEFVNDILKAVYVQFSSDLLKRIDFSLVDAKNSLSPLAYWLMLVKCFATLEVNHETAVIVCVESFEGQSVHFRKLVQSIVDTAPPFIRFIIDSRLSVSDPITFAYGEPVRDYFVAKLDSLLSGKVTSATFNSIIQSTCTSAVYAEISYRIASKLISDHRPIELLLPVEPDQDWLHYVLTTLLLPSQLANLVTICLSAHNRVVEPYNLDPILVDIGLLSSGERILIHPVIIRSVLTNFSVVT
jgi:hypothetical protein